MRARWLAALWLLALPAAARGDAGTVALREARGPLVVTLLVGPTPLRAGPVELEVLVQSSATGAPVLDTGTALRLAGPGPGDRLEAVAEPGVGGNQLFQGARVALASPGTWQIELLVTDAAGAEETFHTRLEVAPPRGPARRYWAWIAAAPAGLALLALHQALGLATLPRARRSRCPPWGRT
jgi:hypothetical protein